MRLSYLIIVPIVLIGLFLRLYHISANQFLFYDEALYIGYNRTLLNLIAHNPGHTLSEWGIIFSLIFKTALSMPKALWFFILSMRVFGLGPEAWFFARLVSAACGLGTVVLLYFWARRYFNSPRIALLSALILLVLPSHVFYSRLGMQESLSTLLFLGAIYLYTTMPDRLNWKLFVSAFLLACVYLTNYRMIVGPVFIVFIEGYKALTAGQKLPWQKLAVYLAAFAAVVILVGVLYGGINFYVCFAWMFHQAKDASGNFNFINFLSYPYDTFALEGFFFACFFWANPYLIKYKEYKKLLPFGIVLVQMAGFSLAAEKGARYLCVVLPFMATAAAIVIDDAWERWPSLRKLILGAGACSLVVMVYLSGAITFARTDYEQAVRFITSRDPKAVIVSTQPLVEGLFMADDKRIVPCPQDAYALLDLYKQGARYLIIDPQAYVSWTADGRRFSPPLDDVLQTALRHVRPLAVFDHINDNILLTRLVLDHNEQILDSLKFLSVARKRQYGKIRIYDLESIFSAIMHK
ncbi:MAG: glycosyltransferase family 39 protein [Candidatus Omnitrophica bacterium]|nr:glycosyltransferase family 39 protein [Candidatus Omnitrophota bacterium]MDE2222509.1 glycosyltransferase family 39 protein [Candidatus Omnitrophota bacterium]